MHVVPYIPPTWATSLRIVPAFYLKLANRPSPVTQWKTKLISSKFQGFIKRDDLTGGITAGNKVRKLEFLLHDAISQGCRHIITCGSLQSNHCRAVAAASTELGLNSHLFLRTSDLNIENLSVDGNMFLSSFLGSQIYLIEKNSPYATLIKPKMETLARKIKQKTNEDSYIIPVGGSNPLGVWGYIECFKEILEQVHSSNIRIDDIFCVCGSGGTAAGLAIANALSGSPFKMHGISVCDDQSYFHGHINEMLKALGMYNVKSQDIITIHDGYKGKGYGVSQPHELKFIREIAVQTGIVLDNVYTGKAAFGMCDLIHHRPHVLKGTNFLFIHSGGIFSLLSKEMTKAYYSELKSSIRPWSHDLVI